MKMILALIITVQLLLHSQVSVGLDPTYEELKSQLPIELQPNGDDQFFFFIVPVQKNDEPNVILQMAQAQDATKYANGSLSATRVNTADSSLNVSMGENLDLDNVFSTPEDEGSSDFNFQVPVIVPLDFRFTYDGSGDSLPQCTVDSRTWKERVITKIAEKLQLPGKQSWDHSDLTIRIRLRKDVLSSITVDYINNTDELHRYISTVVQTKYLSDIRYTSLLNDIITLTAEHIAIISEGVDTYQSIVNSIAVAEAAVDILDADDANDQTSIEITKVHIDTVKPAATVALQKFKDALVIVRDLQELAALEEDEEE